MESVSGCYLDIANNTNGAFMPVLISSTGQGLVIPNRGAVRLKHDESIIVSCPGAKNVLEDSKYFLIKIRMANQNVMLDYVPFYFQSF